MESKEPLLNKTKDTGLALILILLILMYVWRYEVLILFAIGVVVLTMVWPTAFKHFAYMWFDFSHFLGNIVSKILLTIIFMVVVMSIGFINRAFSADSMRKRNGSITGLLING